MSVLGNHLYQCTSWHCCERLHLASVNFSEDSFNAFAHFMMGDYKCTCQHHAECSSVFDQKQHDPYAPPSLFTQFYIKWLFLFPWMKKSPQREMFHWCRRGETKNGRSTKQHQNQWVQNCFEQWDKSLDRCAASNGEYTVGDWSLNM